MTSATTVWAILAIVGCWLAALGIDAVALRRPACRPWGAGLATLGLLGLIALMTALWLTLGRPPLRTLGETRLWYAGLTVAAGLFVAWRAKAPWLRLPMLALGALFLGITAANPATLDRTLMPALQSPWFVPHVIVYLLAYALLGLAAGAALWQLIRRKDDASLAIHLVHLGLPFLTCGLVFGAIWAKEAWGHYWAWDPKETWALLTWLAYVALIHRLHDPEAQRRWRGRTALLGILAAFAVVLCCWYLVNLLPAAAVSVHTYTKS